MFLRSVIRDVVEYAVQYAAIALHNQAKVGSPETLKFSFEEFAEQLADFFFGGGKGFSACRGNGVDAAGTLAIALFARAQIGFLFEAVQHRISDTVVCLLR